MTRVLLLRHGEMPSSNSPPPGEPRIVVVVVLRGKQYHVVAAVEGHELETPEAEHRLGLERLLKSTHLELNGKVFVNTQQAPTWRANCRHFGPGGSLDRRVNLCCVPLPRWVGTRWNTSGGMSLVLSCTRVLVVGVTSVARERGRERESRRERERERERVRPCSSSPVPLSCVYSSLLPYIRVFVRCSYVRMLVCRMPPAPRPIYAIPRTSPFIDIRKWPSCTMGV
jgi:hypothetical protein